MVGVILHSSGSQGRRCSHFLLTVLFVAEGTMAATEGTMAATESLRVLVTGASGYLGQFLLDEMLRRNQTVGGRHIIVMRTHTHTHTTTLSLSLSLSLSRSLALSLSHTHTHTQ